MQLKLLQDGTGSLTKNKGINTMALPRTPATTWISSINESSDWLSVNDPCAIELGSGWRLPTNTEWTNVDATGGWTTWAGPYVSGLKLHAAGFLLNSDGSLINRNYSGYYWSRTQAVANQALYLNFDNGQSAVYGNYKAFGMSVRCIKD